MYKYRIDFYSEYPDHRFLRRVYKFFDYESAADAYALTVIETGEIPGAWYYDLNRCK